MNASSTARWAQRRAPTPGSALHAAAAFTSDDVEVDVHWTAETVDALLRARPRCRRGVRHRDRARRARHQRRSASSVRPPGGFGSRYVPVSSTGASSMPISPWAPRCGASARREHGFPAQVFDRVGHFDELWGPALPDAPRTRSSGTGSSPPAAVVCTSRVMVTTTTAPIGPGCASSCAPYMKGTYRGAAYQHKRYGHQRQRPARLPPVALFFALRRPGRDRPLPASVDSAGRSSGAGSEGILFALRLRSGAISKGTRALQKTSLARFLAANPFPNPFTDGLFYREKMRAIHRSCARLARLRRKAAARCWKWAEAAAGSQPAVSPGADRRSIAISPSSITARAASGAPTSAATHAHCPSPTAPSAP